MDHRLYMRLALAEAEKAFRRGEVPIGAVVVKGGQVIASSHNLKETTNDPTAHAEMLAIKAAAERLGAWRLGGSTLYVTLEPCPMCAGALVQARVDRLVYGAFDPKAGAAGSVVDLVENPRLNHRVEVIQGILEEECKQLLQRFFSEVRG